MRGQLGGGAGCIPMEKADILGHMWGVGHTYEDGDVTHMRTVMSSVTYLPVFPLSQVSV